MARVRFADADAFGYCRAAYFDELLGQASERPDHIKTFLYATIDTPRLPSENLWFALCEENPIDWGKA